MSYNGWTNYMTWRVNLEFVDSMTLEDFVDPRNLFDEDEVDASMRETVVADIIENLFDDYICENSTGLARDIARYAAEDVNWSEIAQHIINDWMDENPEVLAEIDEGESL